VPFFPDTYVHKTFAILISVTLSF